MPPLWRWTDYYNYLVALALITLGALLVQFGGKYYMASMCTLAVFGKMCTLLCIMYGFILPNTTPQFIVTISMLLTFGAGLGLGYGVYNWPKAGIFIMGLYVGCFIGSLVFMMFLSEYSSQASINQL